MASISSNAESNRIYFGDRLQLTNLILDSGATCHMTPEILDFISISMVEMDKYIEVTDGNFITTKKQEKFKLKYMIIVKNPLFPRYITYYLLQNCTINFSRYYVN